MTANEKTLATFETRLRQLLLRFQELKKENAELHAMIGENEKTVSQLKAEMAQKQHDYDSLKMAKMIEITDGNSLVPESFYEPRNQMVYEAIRSLSMEDCPIDVLTVTDKLGKMGKIEEVGGPGYIAELSSRVATFSFIVAFHSE